MTTPRVTVPVEPTEAMIEAGNRALSPWIAPAMHAAEAYRAMLSAAPVPEGGAVLEDALAAWIVEGMKKADQRIAEINPVGCSGMTPEDVKTGRVSAYQKGFQNGVKSTLTDAAFVIMNAAPATREEAPAEAGERGELLQELSDAARWRRLPGNENHLATAALFERAIAALRAQPPARSGEGQ